MAIHWRLKTYLSQKHGICSVTTLQKKIVKKTGILISLQNLCNLINKKPATIRLKTIEIICSGLNCQLSDFCEIMPADKKPLTEITKLSAKNIPLSKRQSINFPDPKDYT